MRTSFLECLEGVRPAGDDRWTARCPAHDDRHASLSVALGDDGRWLLFCHVGCPIGEVLAALHLGWGDLFPTERPPAPARAGYIRVPAARATYLPPRRLQPCRGRQVCPEDVRRWAVRLQRTPRLLERLRELKGWSPVVLDRLGVGWDGRRLTFPVVQAPGQLLGVLRYLPGGGRGDEPKMLATRGAPRTLWPMPELGGRAAAVPLLVVEGEPDAVSGRMLGLDAVAIPGAGSWRESWCDDLERRTLIVVADCDAPGRALAGRVEACLVGRADVRVVDLAPDRDDGHDLGDEVVVAARWGELGLRALRHRLLAAAGLDRREVGARFESRVEGLS